MLASPPPRSFKDPGVDPVRGRWLPQGGFLEWDRSSDRCTAPACKWIRRCRTGWRSLRRAGRCAGTCGGPVRAAGRRRWSCAFSRFQSGRKRRCTRCSRRRRTGPKPAHPTRKIHHHLINQFRSDKQSIRCKYANNGQQKSPKRIHGSKIITL